MPHCSAGDRNRTGCEYTGITANAPTTLQFLNESESRSEEQSNLKAQARKNEVRQGPCLQGESSLATLPGFPQTGADFHSAMICAQALANGEVRQGCSSFVKTSSKRTTGRLTGFARISA